MNYKSALSGFALLETLLMVPLLSLMLVGIYAAGNTLSVLSVAESASHTEALRSGRRQPSLAKNWNTMFPASEKGFQFDASSGSGAKLLPSPFPSLAGRAKVSVSVQRDWDHWTKSALKLDSQNIVRTGELSGDCWDSSTPSGRKVRGVVTVLALSGII